jgi:hypothetical protein
LQASHFISKVSLLLGETIGQELNINQVFVNFCLILMMSLHSEQDSSLNDRHDEGVYRIASVSAKLTRAGAAVIAAPIALHKRSRLWIDVDHSTCENFNL